jgi:predicted acyltransferase
MGELARDIGGDVTPLRPDQQRAERRHVSPSIAPVISAGTEPAAPAAARTQRVGSVDALRGLNIFFIIGADGAALALQQMLAGKGPILSTAGSFLGRHFTHVGWEGLVFYDFIFPLFVFVTGVSIPFSLARLAEREGKAEAHLRIIRRTLLLFLLGVLFYGGVRQGWAEVRWLGVLQRIALCYFFASLLFLNLRPRDLFVAFAALLIGYWALMTFVPVPGIGAGFYEEEANLANWIDQYYLPGRKWNGTWDPEGLLSTLPAIGTCLIGVFAGMLLMRPRLQPQQKTMWLVIGGVALVGLGHLWGLQFPVIKSIWTSSFVLVVGGYSLLSLGVLHQIVDVWGLRTWATPFVWIGANAITLYMLNNVASFERFAIRLVGGDVGSFLDRAVTPGTGRFVAHAVGLLIAIALAGFLYRRKIFLRV